MIRQLYAYNPFVCLEPVQTKENSNCTGKYRVISYPGGMKYATPGEYDKDVERYKLFRVQPEDVQIDYETDNSTFLKGIIRSVQKDGFSYKFKKGEECSFTFKPKDRFSLFNVKEAKAFVNKHLFNANPEWS